MSILHNSAREIAVAIANGSPLEQNTAVKELREAILMQDCDHGIAPAEHAARLRTGLADILSDCLACRITRGHLTTPSESNHTAPQVWIKVRHTAGRAMPVGAFAVGSAPACDVQIAGDDSVSPLQCIVISCPVGIAVVDAWSFGGTRLANPTTPCLASSGLAPSGHVALVLPHGVEVDLVLGVHTTLSLVTKRQDTTAVMPISTVMNSDSTLSLPGEGGAFVDSFACAEDADAAVMHHNQAGSLVPSKLSFPCERLSTVPPIGCTIGPLRLPVEATQGLPHDDTGDDAPQMQSSAEQSRSDARCSFEMSAERSSRLRALLRRCVLVGRATSCLRSIRLSVPVTVRCIGEAREQQGHLPPQSQQVPLPQGSTSSSIAPPVRQAQTWSEQGIRLISCRKRKLTSAACSEIPEVSKKLRTAAETATKPHGHAAARYGGC